MPSKSKLFTALDAQKGRDHKVEKEKKKQKLAERQKREKHKKHKEESQISEGGQEDAEQNGPKLNGLTEGQSTGESEEGEEEEIETRFLDESDSSNQSEDEGVEGEDGEDTENESIALSDMESLPDEEKEDVIPHQRLTINNHSALLSSLRRIALPTSDWPFSEHQSVTSDEVVGPAIQSVDDDLSRELAFYKQSLDAVVEARSRLKKEGNPFSRPTDYFAEMVKTDEHMGKVKKKLVDAAAEKKSAAEARRQRDLKKFGKQVQVAKQQERDKLKRETLDKIQLLKRKRQQSDTKDTDETQLFDVALEDAASGAKQSKSSSNPNFKRQKRDAKYGHGGKKRFAKSGDAVSTGDMSGFSSKRMKSGSKPSKRPGKSKRMKAR